MTRALVIGEALIDVVERDGVVTGEHVGGSPLNVAVGLGRLDRDVDFLTHVGTDDRGRRIADYVEASGVRLVPGSTDAERTPTARARLDAAGGATYEFDLEWQLSGTPEVAPPVVVHCPSHCQCRPPPAITTLSYVSFCSAREGPERRHQLVVHAGVARKRVRRRFSTFMPRQKLVIPERRGEHESCDGRHAMGDEPLRAADLDRFRGGRPHHAHHLGGSYSEGVRFLAERGKAWWLVGAVMAFSGSCSPAGSRSRCGRCEKWPPGSCWR